MVIYDIVNIIGPLFAHFGLVSCLRLNSFVEWTTSAAYILTT